MRTRLFTALAVAALIASSCGDDGVDPQVADLMTGGSSSTTTTTDPPASSTSSTTSTTTTTTTEPQGMCGDLIPVVTDEGTTCVDPDATTTTLDPNEVEWPGGDFWIGNIPPLLIATGTEIVLATFDEDNNMETTPVLTTGYEVRDLRQASDGAIFTVEEVPDVEGAVLYQVYRYELDGSGAAVSQADWLYDIEVVGGVEYVVVAVTTDQAMGEADLVARAIDGGGPPVELGWASGPEFGVTNVDINADGVLVVTAVADLTETVSYIPTSATPEITWTPTDELPYGEPPFVTAASWSEDGTQLVWAEGPDWGWIEEEGELGPIPREWRIRGAMVGSGEIMLDWPITTSTADTSEMSVDSVFDFDSHIVINRSTWSNGFFEPLEPWVIDFTVDEPEDTTIPIAGIVAPAARLD